MMDVNGLTPPGYERVIVFGTKREASRFFCHLHRKSGKNYWYDCAACTSHDTANDKPLHGNLRVIQEHIGICPILKYYRVRISILGKSKNESRYDNLNERVPLSQISVNTINSCTDVTEVTTVTSNSDETTTFSLEVIKRIVPTPVDAKARNPVKLKQLLDVTWFEFVTLAAGKFSIDSDSLNPFLDEVQEGLRPPNRRKIMKMLEQTDEICQEIFLEFLKPSDILTLSMDTWSNIKGESVSGVVLTTAEGTAIPYRIDNVSGPKHDKAWARNYIESVMSVPLMKDKIVAVVTDSEASLYHAKRVLALKYPHILFLPCFAHQANLFIKSIAESASFKGMINCVKRTVNFVKGSATRLSLFQQMQTELGIQPLALRLSVDTRWNSIFDMLDSVAHSLLALQTMLAKLPDGRHDKETSKTFNELQDLWKDPGFTNRVLYAKEVFKRLKIQQDMLQNSTTPLSKVLPAFHAICKIAVEALPEAELEVWMAKANKRAQKYWDIDILLTAMILDPFSDKQILNIRWSGLLPHIERAAKRLLPAPCHRVIRLFRRFREEELCANSLLDISKKSLEPMSLPHRERLSCFWHSVVEDYPELSELTKLASILHGVSCNSADPERLFSKLGHLHSKRRNRLLLKNLRRCVQFQTCWNIDKAATHRKLLDMCSNPCNYEDIVEEPIADPNQEVGDTFDELARDFEEFLVTMDSEENAEFIRSSSIDEESVVSQLDQSNRMSVEDVETLELLMEYNEMHVMNELSTVESAYLESREDVMAIHLPHTTAGDGPFPPLHKLSLYNLFSIL